MSKVDISSEAVGSLAQECERVSLIGGSDRTHIAATLRAQAERIKELEGDVTNLVTQRDNAATLAERLGRVSKEARNEALREAAAICTGDSERPAKIGGYKLRRMSASEQFAYETTRMAWQDADEILALIEGATND